MFNWKLLRLKIKGCNHCNNGAVECDGCRNLINVGEKAIAAETLLGWAYYHPNCYTQSF